VLRHLIARNEIRGIAEEMNKESLKRHFCPDESIAFQLAQELGIGHRYCDPDTATRAERSIEKGNFEKRELYWLEQLQTFDGFPALFIMGADHFESFKNLLIQSGFQVCEVCRDWVPSDSRGDDLDRFFTD